MHVLPVCAHAAPACAYLAFVCVLASLLVLADTACPRVHVVFARAPCTRVPCTCLRVPPLCLPVCFVLHLFDIPNGGEFPNPLIRVGHAQVFNQAIGHSPKVLKIGLSTTGNATNKAHA